MKKFVVAALLVSASAHSAVIISKPVYVAPKANTSSNTALVAATAAAVVISTTASNQANSQTVSVADEDADTKLANVNIPLLTICSESKFAHAIQWQSACKVLSGNANLGIADTCSLLSYQRFCEPATVEDIKGKRPALPHYINTYMR